MVKSWAVEVYIVNCTVISVAKPLMIQHYNPPHLKKRKGKDKSKKTNKQEKPIEAAGFFR